MESSEPPPTMSRSVRGCQGDGRSPGLRQDALSWPAVFIRCWGPAIAPQTGETDPVLVERASQCHLSIYQGQLVFAL